jgi:hypothetical protein
MDSGGEEMMWGLCRHVQGDMSGSRHQDVQARITYPHVIDHSLAQAGTPRLAIGLAGFGQKLRQRHQGCVENAESRPRTSSPSSRRRTVRVPVCVQVWLTLHVP